MSKTNKVGKGKGNRDDAKHFIDFYESKFFGIVDDEKKNEEITNIISLNVRIDKKVPANNKTNVAEHRVPEIKDFSDVESTLNSILQLKNKVFPSKIGINGRRIDYIKMKTQHIRLLCINNNANTIFQHSCNL